MMDTTYLLCFAGILLGVCIVFPHQIQDGIRRLYWNTYNWITIKEKPSASDLVTTFILFVCFVSAVIGMYYVLCMFLPFVFPVSPPHLAAALVSLSTSVGIATHLSKGTLRYFAVGLAVLLPLCFAGLGFLQMSEEMDARGETGVQPYVAGWLIGVISACEIITCATLLSRWNALGFLWFILLSPLLLVFFVAWIFGLVRDIPQRITSWTTALKEHRWRNHIALEPVREELARARIADAYRRVQEVGNIAECRTKVDTTRKKHQNMRGSARSLIVWTRIYYSLISFGRGFGNARAIYAKYQKNFLEHFNVSMDRIQKSYKSNYSELPHKQGQFIAERQETVVEEIHQSDNGNPSQSAFKTTLSVCIASGLLAWNSAMADPRLISVYLDGTGSFPYLEEAKEHAQASIVSGLGPNDIVVITRLGNFAHQTGLQLKFPRVDPDIVDKVHKTIYEWKPDNKAIKEAWKEADSLKQVTVHWLNKLQPQEGGATQFHEMLSYASVNLSPVDAEKWLVVYSDLYQESSGADKTRFPPQTLFDFTNVHVRFLFVPFDGYENWRKLQDAWSTYFEKGGASSFRMFDIASSSMVQDLLPGNALPKKLPPFRPQ